MLSNMFAESPPWDKDRKYKPESMNIWVENKEKETIFKIDINAPLNVALRHEENVIFGGCPSFIITVHQSPFEKNFVDKYEWRSKYK